MAIVILRLIFPAVLTLLLSNNGNVFDSAMTNLFLSLSPLKSWSNPSCTESDVDVFLDSNIEADNYIPEDYDFDQEMDNFGNFKKRIQNFKDELQIPHQKDDKDNLFNAICYAAR